jgi:fused signal recognition particle receptor
MIQTLFGTVEQEPSLLEKLKSGVQKTRAGLVTALEDALQGKREINADLLDELESTLISADVGVRTTEEILDRIRERVSRHQLNDAGELKGLIREHLLEILAASERAPARVMDPPAVVLVIGVNGSGKTTTIGKLAARFQSEQRSVLLSAVLFDALNAARARKSDYVIVDTAGRLQTKENLMAELQKMSRTAKKVIPDAPHEVLLVLDATTGQNGLEQARKFTETSGVTGIVLTKLDGTAKGGIVIAIARELNLPIRYIGVGEKAQDLLPFDSEKFIQSLFE